MNFFSSVTVLVLVSAFFVEAEVKCVTARGQIKCYNDPETRIKIILYNANVIFDEKMGESFTDKDGNFEIYGCGSDIIGLPDPYVYYSHYCNSIFSTEVSSDVAQIFEPEIYDYGGVEIDPKNRPKPLNSIIGGYDPK